MQILVAIGLDCEFPWRSLQDEEPTKSFAEQFAGGPAKSSGNSCCIWVNFYCQLFVCVSFVQHVTFYKGTRFAGRPEMVEALKLAALQQEAPALAAWAPYPTIPAS